MTFIRTRTIHQHQQQVQLWSNEQEHLSVNTTLELKRSVDVLSEASPAKVQRLGNEDAPSSSRTISPTLINIFMFSFDRQKTLLQQSLDSAKFRLLRAKKKVVIARKHAERSAQNVKRYNVVFDKPKLGLSLVVSYRQVCL